MKTTAILMDDLDGAASIECDVTSDNDSLSIKMDLRHGWELLLDLDDLLSVIGDEGHG